MTPLKLWIIFNVIISLFEIYGYTYQNLLMYSTSDILLATWREYGKVDPRYINTHYVWLFELFNVFNTCMFFINVKIALFGQIIGTVLYFLTYFVDNPPPITVKTPFYLATSFIWIAAPIYLLR